MTSPWPQERDSLHMHLIVHGQYMYVHACDKSMLVTCLQIITYIHWLLYIQADLFNITSCMATVLHIEVNTCMDLWNYKMACSHSWIPLFNWGHILHPRSFINFALYYALKHQLEVINSILELEITCFWVVCMYTCIPIPSQSLIWSIFQICTHENIYSRKIQIIVRGEGEIDDTINLKYST